MTFTIICLDGFKYDYLKKAKFLKKLSKRGIYGRVFHGFGYASELSALTGKDVEELGIISNNFIYKEDRLKFYNLFKNVKDNRFFKLILDLIYNSKEFLVGNNQPKSIFNIPLKSIRYFDFLMKKNFFSQNIAGNETLFGKLRKMGKKTIAYMWPFIYEHDRTKMDILNLGLNTSKTDDRTFSKSIDLLKKNPDVAYIHFFSTDNLVHKSGTDSKETEQLILKLDSFVEKISAYSDSLLIFSDHGMVDVRETWNLWKEISNFNLVYGKDFVMFLDSTLARFWFKNKNAEIVIKNMLEKSKKGKIVTFKNPHIKKYFGDLIFQVNPGILILPNFYQSKPDKAMHGYSDEYADEQGLYIFCRKGVKRKKQDIEIKKIFDLIVSNL